MHFKLCFLASRSAILNGRSRLPTYQPVLTHNTGSTQWMCGNQDTQFTHLTNQATNIQSGVVLATEVRSSLLIRSPFAYLIALVLVNARFLLKTSKIDTSALRACLVYTFSHVLNNVPSLLMIRPCIKSLLSRCGCTALH